MNHTQSVRLKMLLDNNFQHLVCGGLKGIEKESLRLDKQGLISRSDHPQSLGSALTNPYITTDYSEALIELITPPFQDIQETLGFLQNLHQFVYSHLQDEILLATSMPCGIDGDESIRIAEYGTSNIGRMKHIYRHGLWHRYGRTMQAIAGVHFNYSVPEALWQQLHVLENSSLGLEQFTSKGYFAMIRNFQRFGWIILYLFGASPAICKQFFKSRPELMTHFEEFNKSTLYHPFATSLRMSDIGYKSKNQASLNIDYNSLDAYVNSLGEAINTPYPDYEKIGVLVDGHYRQLNSNILQIENEFYSIIRPKQIAMSCEKPTHALKTRGVRYVEMRSLDLDLFTPLGIDAEKAFFIEALLLSCMLNDSPDINEAEHQINNYNQLAVANSGRKPGLELKKINQTISLQDWANEILDAMQPVCAILDNDNSAKPYSKALQQQRLLVENPGLTPSARLIDCMTASNCGFAEFAHAKSVEHAAFFSNCLTDNDSFQKLSVLADESHQEQHEIEAADKLDFAAFLSAYFSGQLR